MRDGVKRMLKVTRLHRPAQYLQAVLWATRGRPAPPPHIVKQRTLLDYARSYQLRVLVETGTFYGDMVDAMKHQFSSIISIELSPYFYEKAKQRFHNDKHVEIIQGDSAKVLATLIKRLNQPVLYWLDGHHSGGMTARGEKDTPVLEELEQILRIDDRSVILIDDARDFGHQPSYPTIAELRAFVNARVPDHVFELRDDIIRISPGKR